MLMVGYGAGTLYPYPPHRISVLPIPRDESGVGNLHEGRGFPAMGMEMRNLNGDGCGDEIKSHTYAAKMNAILGRSTKDNANKPFWEAKTKKGKSKGRDEERFSVAEFVEESRKRAEEAGFRGPGGGIGAGCGVGIGVGVVGGVGYGGSGWRGVDFVFGLGVGCGVGVGVGFGFGLGRGLGYPWDYFVSQRKSSAGTGRPNKWIVLEI
ncbi:hypothetical protein Scep_016708 [Stephania cephalantha]|uniref:Uncharacterized protein n=1 Tax=Stephania cephalantha TaxID=152367 RepID=A0AAP0NUX6_9MAGN